MITDKRSYGPNEPIRISDVKITEEAWPSLLFGELKEPLPLRLDTIMSDYVIAYTPELADYPVRGAEPADLFYGGETAKITLTAYTKPADPPEVITSKIEFADMAGGVKRPQWLKGAESDVVLTLMDSAGNKTEQRLTEGKDIPAGLKVVGMRTV